MMKSSTPSSSSKLDRKIVERNRRLLVKQLLLKLASVIPTKDDMSQQDLLEQATNCVKGLEERIKKLRESKELMMNVKGTNDNIMTIHSRSPIVELKESDLTLELTLELTLITGLEKNFNFHEALTVLEEEGAEVVNASFSTLGARVFHIVHSRVKWPRIGVDTSRILERLKEFVY